MYKRQVLEFVVPPLYESVAKFVKDAIKPLLVFGDFPLVQVMPKGV